MFEWEPSETMGNVLFIAGCDASASRIEPPVNTAVIPAGGLSCHAEKGKSVRSEYDPGTGSWERSRTSFHQSTRDILPEPTPTVWMFGQRQSIDVVCDKLSSEQQTRISCSVGSRLVNLRFLASACGIACLPRCPEICLY